MESKLEGIKAERSPSTSYVLLCRLEAGEREGIMSWCFFIFVECVTMEKGEREKGRRIEICW